MCAGRQHLGHTHVRCAGGMQLRAAGMARCAVPARALRRRPSRCTAYRQRSRRSTPDVFQRQALIVTRAAASAVMHRAMPTRQGSRCAARRRAAICRRPAAPPPLPPLQRPALLPEPHNKAVQYRIGRESLRARSRRKGNRDYISLPFAPRRRAASLPPSRPSARPYPPCTMSPALRTLAAAAAAAALLLASAGAAPSNNGGVPLGTIMGRGGGGWQVGARVRRRGAPRGASGGASARRRRRIRHRPVSSGGRARSGCPAARFRARRTAAPLACAACETRPPAAERPAARTVVIMLSRLFLPHVAPRASGRAAGPPAAARGAASAQRPAAPHPGTAPR